MTSLISKICFVMVFMLISGESFGAVYVDNKDGTITDAQHGLMWQKSDDGVERVWSAAGKYCDNLDLAGYSDWKLPSINLLAGLIEPASSPTVPNVFSVKPSYYWSVSESHNNIQSAKYINFFYGNTYAYNKDNTYYALCVRDAAKGQDNNLTASFSHEETGEAPIEISFSSVIHGGSAPYFIEWDFGDGETASVQSPVHIFTDFGHYKVLLTVSDNDGDVSSASQEIVLQEKEAGEFEKIDLALSGPLDDAVNKEVGGEVYEGGDQVVPAVNPGEIAHLQAKDGTNDTELGDVSVKLEEPLTVISEMSGGGTSIVVPAGQTDNTGLEAEELVPAVLGTALGKLPQVEVSKKPGGEPVTELTSSEGAEVVAGLAEGEGEGEGKQEVTSASFLEIMVNINGVDKIKELGHGLLAYAFTNGLRGDADWNKDGLVTARDMKGFIAAAVENLAQGEVQTDFKLGGEDFGICAPHGSTYLLAAGVNLYHDEFTPLPFVERDIIGLQKVMASTCPDSKTAVIVGEHANRAEFLQALKKIGGMIGPQDQVIFYFGGLSEQQGSRLNLLFNDTIKGMTAFTGLFYDDIAEFLKGLPGGGVTIMLETNRAKVIYRP